MKTGEGIFIGAASFALYLAVLPLYFSASAEWDKYKPEGESFSIEMMGVPVEEVVTSQTGAGEIEYKTLVWSDESMKMTLYYADFPSRYIQQTDITNIFNERRNTILRETGGRLGFEKNIFFESFGGRELMIEAPVAAETEIVEPFRVYTRYYLVYDRFYEARIEGYFTKGFEKAVERYLESFKIYKLIGSEIDSHLRYLGIDYKVEDGQYTVTVGVDGGRSQIVIITPLNTDFDNRKYFDIWSPVGAYQGVLGSEMAESLLVANSSIDLGSYQVIENEEGGRMMVFSAQVAEGMEVNVFKRVLIMVSKNADSMERSLTGADQY